MGRLEATSLAIAIGSSALGGVLGYRAAERRGRRSIAWAISCALFLVPLIVLVQLPSPTGAGAGVWPQWKIRVLATVLLWFTAVCIGALHLHSGSVAHMEARVLALWFGEAVKETPVPSVWGYQGVLRLDGEFGGPLVMTMVAASLAVLLWRPSWLEIILLCSLGLATGILARATQLIVSVGSWIPDRYDAPHLSPAPIQLASATLFWATAWFARRERSGPQP